jgi:hypothetical protein
LEAINFEEEKKKKEKSLKWRQELSRAARTVRRRMTQHRTTSIGVRVMAIAPCDVNLL